MYVFLAPSFELAKARQKLKLLTKDHDIYIAVVYLAFKINSVKKTTVVSKTHYINMFSQVKNIVIKTERADKIVFKCLQLVAKSK